jgi:hypothetical protein
MREKPVSAVTVSIIFAMAVLPLGAQEVTDWTPQMEPQVLAVEKLGPFLPHVQEVEIDLLGGIGSGPAYGPSVVDEYKIINRKTVGGTQAQNIADCWRMLPRSPWLSMMCHNPPYGLRFRTNGKLILDTTICWHCQNYDFLIPGNATKSGLVEWGFDGNSQAAKLLLKLLQ